MKRCSEVLSMIDQKRLSGILDRIKQTTVGVVGDYCLDAYWLLDTRPPELSIETRKPTSAVVKQRYSLGGAGNIVNNLLDLEVGIVYTFGVISDDLFGREMLRQLEQPRVHRTGTSQLRVDISGMVIQHEGWDTPVYAKPYLGVEEQSRIDFGRFNSILQATEEKLIAALSAALPSLDALIVNQQLPSGIYSETIVQALNRLATEYSEKVFILDSRNRSDEFHNMICKINASEAARVCGETKESSELVPLDDVKRYAQEIFRRLQRTVFITRSGRGILLFDGRAFCEIPGIQIKKKTDPVGAGDTTVAAIAAALASGASLEEAGILGNLASAVTVQKLQQTGTATPEELMETAQTADYLFQPAFGKKTSSYQRIEIKSNKKK